MTVQPPNHCDVSTILDTMCPMHLVLDATGHIRHVGPTLQKLRPDRSMTGARFLEVFELNRPRAMSTMADLLTASGVKLHLQFRAEPRTAFKGELMPGPDPGEATINLSFGISIMDAVRDYSLTSADFAATDLAVEMLYLVEAKSAAMDASRTLNLRLQGAMIAAEEQAFTDTLTGLKNRRAMDHVLGRLMEGCDPFALMQLDLDFFKAVNDSQGHAAGDHVLQIVARIMVDETREKDTVARVGGDEFVLLFPGLTDHKTLGELARRVIDRLESPIPFEGTVCSISASIGTVLSSDYKSPAAETLLADADVALYASKHAGRACHRFFVPELRLPAEIPTTSPGIALPDAPNGVCG